MENEQKILVKGDDLKKLNIYAYGIGHYLNDLCASCWFFYLSYYLTDIAKIGASEAGYVMLAGQLADALATPTVGILSDNFSSRIGKRTPFYIGGTLLVIITFTLIFVKIIPEDSSKNLTLIYYMSCAALFNIGWASVQVSHMALLPQLSLNRKKKDEMNRVRTGFTFLAQTVAISFSFLYFNIIKNSLLQYKVLAVTCVSVGTITSVIFLILCRENILSKNLPKYYQHMRESLSNYRTSVSASSDKLISTSPSPQSENEESSTQNINGNGVKKIDDEKDITWTYWFTKADFYIYMLVYMFVRLSINITQSIIPYYMEYVLDYQKTEEGGTRVEVSIVLLISTLGSILNSLILQNMIEMQIKRSKNSRLIMITIAAMFVLIGCFPMFFLNKDFRYPIYGLAFFFGVGFSQGLSTVSNLINDVVGSKGAQGAFVYGAYSFADKLSCGLVLVFFLPIANNPLVLEYSMPIFPPVSLILAFLIVLIRMVCKIRRKRNQDLNNVKISDKNKKSIIDSSKFTFINE